MVVHLTVTSLDIKVPKTLSTRVEGHYGLQQPLSHVIGRTDFPQLTLFH